MQGLSRVRRWFIGLGLLLAAGACGREFTAVGRTGLGAVALNPVFGTIRLAGSGEVLNVASIVQFTRVRIVLLRANGDTAVDRVVEFPADSTSISLAIPVVLSATAPAEGETLNAALRFVNSAGDTVFSSAPVAVQARPLGSPPAPPPDIPVTYTGPGASAASLRVSPDSIVDRNGAQVPLVAVVRDAQGTTLPNTPVAYTSTDTTKVKVGLSSGIATLVGFRGGALVIAQTLTGQRDTVPVTIVPTPSAVAVVTGNSQQTRQGALFPTPLRLRVTAGDGLPVVGSIVTFEVTQGGGTVSAARDTADAEGLVEVRWTAGDLAGPGSVVARVEGTTLSATITGTQLSSAPTSITFGTQPTAIVAGDTLPSIVVQVRDATGDTAIAFNGQVRLALSGGTAGARILGGDTLATAVGGVARFRALTVDRGGTAYRLAASIVGGGTGSPTALSNAFDVTPAPPAVIRILSGDGQTGITGAALRDSIAVEVVDRFGLPVVGASVAFTTAGGGSVSPATVATTTAGRAATRWTLGASGSAQRLTATVGSLSVTASAYMPVQMKALAGAGQSALFGQPFATPVEFLVEGDSARPLRGIVVRYTVSGKGTLSQSVDTSDVAGRVSVVWTAGDSAGVAVLSAAVEGMPAIATSVTGTQGTAGVSAVVFETQPTPIVAGDTLPTLRVAVRNGLGQVIAGFTGAVTLALMSNEVSVGATPGLVGTTTVTAVGGRAAFPGLTVQFRGPYWIEASVVEGTTTFVTRSQDFTVTQPPPAAIGIETVNPQVSVGGIALPDSVRATVRDRFGYAIPGATVTFTVEGGGSVSPATVTTNGVGRAATQWTLGLTGTQRLTAAVGTVSATLDARIPTALTLTSGGGQSALFGAPFAQVIRFRVSTEGGAALAGIPVAFTTTRGGKASPAGATTDASGEVSTTWTAGDTVGVAELRATVVGMSAITAVASGIQATPDPNGLKIDLTPPTITAGDLLPTVVVRVLNGLGDSIPAFTGPVRVGITGGTAGATLLGTVERNAVAGVARFPELTIDRGGEGYRLTAVAVGLTPVIATNTDTFTVRAAPVAALVVTAAPTTATSGQAFGSPVRVELQDRFGFRVAGATASVTATLSRGSGTLYAVPPATLTQTAVDGVVTFAGLAIEGSGEHNLRLTLNDAIGVISPTITVDPGPVGIQLRVGATPTTTVATNAEVAIPLQLNFDNRGTANLASLTVTLTWDPTQFQYVSEFEGAWVDDNGGASTVLVNFAETASGRLTITGFANDATTANFLLRTVRLKALSAPSGIRTVGATVSVAGNAAGGTTTVLPRPLTVTVTP